MKVEILAPGGSKKSVISAINAGADAVYTGGQLFGAREYADNLTTEELIEVINYAHIHGRRIYLTVNTLLKDKEIERNLYDYILPLYEKGLDAVIIQDFGVMKFIHDKFPLLPIHASTQMTIMGKSTVEFLKKYGVTRIVTPRELNLKEISDIKYNTGMEIESFVHGALCYCYSGQCFLSSYIGGRSGNRGKCAQPCRLPYDVIKDKRTINNEDEKYILSPKDICTLNILPDVIESGVYSLKIEGRMKRPEYTAGMTALYRKYVDLYLEKGRNAYEVSKEDYKKALDLFNRNGFSESYYKQHNSKDMISLKKPNFREENTSWTEYIRKEYIEKEPKENINIFISILKDEKVKLETNYNGHYVQIEGAIPVEAKNAPLTKENVVKQISKLGGTAFVANTIEVKIDDGVFVTVGELNKLRRELIEELCNKITKSYERQIENNNSLMISDDNDIKNNDIGISALVNDFKQAMAAINSGKINRLYIDVNDNIKSNIKNLFNISNEKNIQLYIAMPHVFRLEDKNTFKDKYFGLAEYVKGALVRNIEEYFYIKENFSRLSIVFDSSVYSYNKYAKSVLIDLEGSSQITVPLELNINELKHRGCNGEEMVVYGHMPVMITANCVAKTMNKCNKKNETYILNDRMNQKMMVKCVCDYCYNIIYNSNCLSLLTYADEVKDLSVSNIRLEFTKEDVSEVLNVIDRFYDGYILSETNVEDFSFSTRGHFKRGVK